MNCKELDVFTCVWITYLYITVTKKQTQGMLLGIIIQEECSAHSRASQRLYLYTKRPLDQGLATTIPREEETAHEVPSLALVPASCNSLTAQLHSFSYYIASVSFALSHCVPSLC